MNEERKLVLLGRFHDSVQAHILRGFLENEGIECFIMDEHHNSTAWHLGIALGGVRLMVPAEDHEKARKILQGEMLKYKQERENAPLIRKPYLKTFLGTLAGLFAGAPSIPPSNEEKP